MKAALRPGRNSSTRRPNRRFLICGGRDRPLFCPSKWQVGGLRTLTLGGKKQWRRRSVASPAKLPDDAIERLLLQKFRNFSRVRFRVGDGNPMFLDRTIRSDQGRGADRSFDRFALGVLSRSPGTICFHDPYLRVRQEYKR